MSAFAGARAWPAPAKLNLFLRVIGRRPDGYHDLQTVFQLLDWGDTLRVLPRSDGRISRTASFGDAVAEQDDLVVRAAKLLKKSANVSQGADISLEKRIPMGGGFGGGSSDAATTLVALNHLWQAGLDTGALAALGLQLGADVPVFVHGRNAWAEGVGERLTPLELPPSWYLLLDTGISVATAELFQAPDLTRDAPAATISDFVSDPHSPGLASGNAFEPVLRRREPVVDAALAELSRFGWARLTGTGGGCFVRFADREAAERARDDLSAHWRVRVVAGAEHSPLLDALAAAEQ